MANHFHDKRWANRIFANLAAHTMSNTRTRSGDGGLAARTLSPRMATTAAFETARRSRRHAARRQQQGKGGGKMLEFVLLTSLALTMALGMWAIWRATP